MATIPDAGLNALATQVQSLITYVAVGTGCGTLSSGLTSGNAYTTLALTTGLPANVAAAASLTITDGTHNQVVTVTGAGALAGATSIPVVSFVASATFAPSATGVVTTPQSSDLTLFNETSRLVATIGVAGAAAGESLNSAYFDPTTPSGVYVEVGYFGGATASSSPNTGALIARDIQFWNHVVNVDSASFQLDSTV